MSTTIPGGRREHAFGQAQDKLWQVLATHGLQPDDKRYPEVLWDRLDRMIHEVRTATALSRVIWVIDTLLNLKRAGDRVCPVCSADLSRTLKDAMRRSFAASAFECPQCSTDLVATVVHVVTIRKEGDHAKETDVRAHDTRRA